MVPLRAGRELVVGRARPSDIPIRDRSLSRQHARFSLVQGALWVEDLGSTNGTRLNGRTIKRSQVQSGDEVTLGAVTAVLHALEPNAEAPSGLDGHDRFLTRLEQQLANARTFRRPLAVLMVSAAGSKQAHVGHWAPGLRKRLRPADALGLYGPNEVLVCLAELDGAAAQMQAQQIVSGRAKGGSRLLCGIANYPADGTSTEELIEAARIAARQATPKSPVCVTPGEQAKPPRGAAEAPVVSSPKTRQLFATAKRIASAAIPVLICGETGTGKEVLARAIHHESPRRGKPLRCVNCGAIPETLIESALFGHERGAFTSADRQAAGVFEQANGGSVLLDEIGELSPAAQTALLRVIESKRVMRVGGASELPVDVRVMAATHRDLDAMCEAGEFRWDLYYRLNTMTLQVPPLRERAEEIPLLAEYFMRAAAKANHCAVRYIDDEARELLEAYHWPGNIRELRNVMERATVVAQEDTITLEDLSERVRRAGQDARSSVAAQGGLDSSEGVQDLKERVRRYEAQLLLEALEQNDWNQTRTAQGLNMPLRTLVHKIRQHGLKKRYEK